MGGLMLVVGAMAVATALVYLIDRPGSDRRITARLYRASTGWRARLLVGGGLAVWTGFSFVAGWILVRFPRNTEFRIGEQPAPDWLWQLGLGLSAAGLAVVVGVMVTASARVAREVSARSREPRTWLVMTVGLACFCVPMAIAAAAASASAFAWVPLFIAVMSAAMIVVNQRTHWFW